MALPDEAVQLLEPHDAVLARPSLLVDQHFHHLLPQLLLNIVMCRQVVHALGEKVVGGV